MNINGRYKDELHSIIGSFVTTLPCRVQLDPNGSFEQLVEQVRDRCLSVLEHSHYPLQHIVGSHHAPAFLETMFDYITIDSAMEQVNLDGALLQSTSFEQYDHVAKFDMMLTLFQHPSDRLSCSLICSQDVFSEKTVQTLADRFLSLLKLLFAPARLCMTKLPLYHMSIIVPEERQIINALKTKDISRVQLADGTVRNLFIKTARTYSQKIAVELDEQSLTYSELLFYVQQFSLVLIGTHSVCVGEIVCQCVERSLSMVIGMMAIEMAGAVYCPLSPEEPVRRLQSLVEETRSRLVVIHNLTRDKFNACVSTVLIDASMSTENMLNANELDRLSNVFLSGDNISYVIFTSGSTGTPKAIQVRHRNLTEAIRSQVELNTLSKSDTLLQMARCSFDVHVGDVIGTLIVGATLVMLHPDGHIDFEYLSQVLIDHQITYMEAVPTLLTSFFHYLEDNMCNSARRFLRSLCSGGEPIFPQLIKLLRRNVQTTCRIWNSYGPAEATINCTFHLLDCEDEQSTVPIGRLLPGYRCVVIDQFLEPVFLGQEGELVVGGIGVFAGYLGSDNLTKHALIDIDGELFYRTGDLVRLSSSGVLNFVGRKDYQIKLRGQRVELGEIERCLLESSPFVSSTAVVKYDDHHLVAYIQSNNIEENELAKYCRSHLPSYMVPSAFVVLKQFPLNANGKLDRKLLPKPSFSGLSTVNHLFQNHKPNLEPNSELEMRLHSLWCEALQSNHISTSDSIFTIGGHSLTLIHLYARYKKIFGFNTRHITIGQIFQHPTISDHAYLIKQALSAEQHQEECWPSLHIDQGQVSFAQERIFLDERIRFSSQGN
ncbi:unnamed protein product, partial [Adineta ricciae]